LTPRSGPPCRHSARSGGGILCPASTALAAPCRLAARQLPHAQRPQLPRPQMHLICSTTGRRIPASWASRSPWGGAPTRCPPASCTAREHAPPRAHRPPLHPLLAGHPVGPWTVGSVLPAPCVEAPAAARPRADEKQLRQLYADGISLIGLLSGASECKQLLILYMRVSLDSIAAFDPEQCAICS